MSSKCRHFGFSWIEITKSQRVIALFYSTWISSTSLIFVKKCLTRFAQFVSLLRNEVGQKIGTNSYMADNKSLLFVCFITKSFLTYSFFPPTPALSTISRLCQAPCVQSHQRQPMSAVAITACEVQVSAADSQTVPTVVTGVSKPLCCRLTLTFTLTSDNLSLCTTLLLLLLLLPFTTMQPTLLTSWLQLLSYKV